MREARMSGLPRYSELALSVRDIFFDDPKEIHFFVEDENLENFYEVLMSRLFPKISRFKIFPLSGKKNVLVHARMSSQSNSHSTKIYVLDKDFDDLLGTILVLKNVFYLDDYCIESSVIDEASLVKICIEERPRILRNVIKQKISYQHAMDHWLPILDKLHRAFALAQKCELKIPNTDLAPEYFSTSTDLSELSHEKVSSYIASVNDALVVSGEISNELEYQELSRSIFGSSRINRKHINGKFLARLYYHRLKRRNLVSNINQDSLLMRCASSSDLLRLRSFRKRVNHFLRSHTSGASP
jgi:Protein of unknown function (DUF4435)